MGPPLQKRGNNTPTRRRDKISSQKNYVAAAVFQCFFQKCSSKMPARIPASRELPAKLSQMPVSPRGDKMANKSKGKIRAVEREMREAARACSRAVIKLWQAKENHRVT